MRFGVLAGEFLGFLVHERGIEIGKRSIESIQKIAPPIDKKELQYLVGKVNFVRRFISNLSGRIEPLAPLLKLKVGQEFRGIDRHQKVLDDIKRYLTSPPVLVPAQRGVPFRLYLSANQRSMGSALTQVQERKERVIFYLSRCLIDVKTRYAEIERLALCLYFSCTKL